MKKIKILYLLATLLVSSSASAALTVIPAANLEADNTTLDFESATVGAIGSTDSLFTNFGLSSINLIGTTSGSDTFNSGADGNGLAATGGALIIVAPNGSFEGVTNNSGYSFNTSGTVTQFGFQMIDQTNHSTTVETYLNGTLVDSVPYSPTSGFPLAPIYYESSQPIDEFRILNDNSNGSWGLDNITIAGLSLVAVTAAIPTLSDFGLGMLILLLFGYSQRRRLGIFS